MICNVQLSVGERDEQIMQMVRNNYAKFEGPGQVLMIKDGRLVFEHVLKGQIFEGNGIKCAD